MIPVDKLANSLKGFLAKLNQLTFNQKMLAGTILSALILSTSFFFFKAKDDYDILYSNLSLPDASAIAAKLKESKTPYRLADGGTTILVPRGNRNQTVLDTANELSGGQTINLTQIPPVVQGDVQKEWIKRLNTGEIADILKSIGGIRNAQVIITQPEHSLFSEDQQVPTASVMLIVEPGFRLQGEQVKTIKNLVAHAVPGLDVDHVAIADNYGNSLEPASALNAGGASDAEVRRKSLEEDIAKKVTAILAPVVGKENVVVSVSAQLNFDQAKTKIHRVIPAGGTAEVPTGLPVSTQEQIEEYANGKKSIGGTPGVEANTSDTASGTPSYQGDQSDKKNGDYRYTKRTTNFTNSEEEKNVVYAPGTVERMTVAVVLNKVLTAQETEEIRELVQNASGVDLARGDSIDIKGFQFSESPASKEKEFSAASKQAQDQAFWLQIASTASVAILGLAALFIFYLLFKKPVEGEVVDDEDELGERFGAASGRLSGGGAVGALGYGGHDDPDALLEEAPIAVLEAKLDPEVEHMRASISNMVEKDAAEAARVLMTYLKDN